MATQTLDSINAIKYTVVFVAAVLLQWALRSFFPQLGYIDFVLIISVYTALKRETLKALMFASIGGLAVDALSGGVLGSSGFINTVITFVVSEIVQRVMVENPLLRIPVLAGASAAKSIGYLLLNRLFGQPPSASMVETTAYNLIGTTVVGTILLFTLEKIFSNRFRHHSSSKRRNYFASRQSAPRRNSIKLGRRI